MTFQEIILNLQKFWSDQGCIVQNPYDIEKGAGTMNPATFLHAIGPEPWRYVMQSLLVVQQTVVMVITLTVCSNIINSKLFVKPSPDNIQELYLQSLATLGIHAEDHDIRFVR